jgi:hypothetical protein
MHVYQLEHVLVARNLRESTRWLKSEQNNIKMSWKLVFVLWNARRFIRNLCTIQIISRDNTAKHEENGVTLTAVTVMTETANRNDTPHSQLVGTSSIDIGYLRCDRTNLKIGHFTRGWPPKQRSSGWK